MEPLEILTSEQFAEFSRAVVGLGNDRKKLTEDFRAAYKAYQEALKAVEDEIKSKSADFEAWKQEFLTSVKDD